MFYLINQRYHLKKRIGHGAFGEIYLAIDTINNTTVVAKLESTSTHSPQLFHEAHVYQNLAQGVGVPAIHYIGTEDTYNVMIMDYLGPNLQQLLDYCNGKFSLKTVCMIAREAILRIEMMHKMGYVHRDIKPDNFVIGLGEKANLLYLIDLGLCKRYWNPTTNTHIMYSENKSIVGTPRYASIGNHLGIEQSRRDDLESLGYVLIYFLLGSLPWQGLRADTKNEKYRRILDCKLNTSVNDLCLNIPHVFYVYINYCRGLRFDETPRYEYLRGLFLSLLEERGEKDDGVYDWMISSIPHAPIALLKQFLEEDGSLLEELKKPAPLKYRKCMLLAEVKEMEKREEEKEEREKEKKEKKEKEREKKEEEKKEEEKEKEKEKEKENGKKEEKEKEKGGVIKEQEKKSEETTVKEGKGEREEGGKGKGGKKEKEGEEELKKESKEMRSHTTSMSVAVGDEQDGGTEK